MDLHVDLHTHIVPDADDGSRGAVETVAMARGLGELGVRRVHLTPHQFRLGNDFAPAELREMADRVAQLLAAARIPLEVVAGAEYCYGERFLRALGRDEELCTFEHGGRPHILVEFPLERPVTGARNVAKELARLGIRPVLAHPERYAARGADLDRMLAWNDAGWLFQLNLTSLVGAHGGPARSRGLRLCAEGRYAFAGSDIHRPWDLEGVRRAHSALREMVPGGVP
jgi:tyrosine-protein phosphatase YwqE